MTKWMHLRIGLAVLAACVPMTAARAQSTDRQPRKIQLRCWGITTPGSPNIHAMVLYQTVRAFNQAYPNIQANSSVGLVLPGGQTGDIIPLMQIAGGIPADCMFVNFRQSDTYISMKLLYPLDQYVESLAGIELEEGYLMTPEQYFAHLLQGPNGAEIRGRVPSPCYPVLFRECPYREDCFFLKKRGVQQPPPKHRHIWSFPVGAHVTGIRYRRDLFAEAGLPDRPPKDWDEFWEWGKRLTEPDEKRYGFHINAKLAGSAFVPFLYAVGGRVVEQDAQGVWRCVFDTPQAVEAAYFMARLMVQAFKTPKGKRTEGIIYDTSLGLSDTKIAMTFHAMDQRYFFQRDPNLYSVGAVPLGPTGRRGSTFNSAMMGIFAGLADDPAKRDAAWKYIHWYDGPQAREIRTRMFVENGCGRFLNPDMLRQYGYPEVVRQVPQRWIEAYKESLANGVPEPYGKNCQRVYYYPSHALSKIWASGVIRRAINVGDEAAAKAEIQKILTEFVNFGNQEMLQIFTPQQKKIRVRVAWLVVIVTVVAFTYVFYRVFKVFTPEQLVHKGGWQFRRYAWCYLLLVPVVGTILLWQYYPLARGTVMAFQNYNVRGFSQWVGMENFAYALFDKKFWFSLWVSAKYAFLYMTFAFFTPIFLAMLLQEVPRGKIIYRVIYYMPAVLSGAVVLFLWRSFYAPSGPINDLIVHVVNAINAVFGSEIQYRRIDWMADSRFALPFCLLPTIWAGMGPGCLIYLAALKTIPEQLYEAADIDGASIRHKVFHIAVPSIKVIIMINFIFALVGAIRGSASFMLAMTGGGPFDEVYGATEVVGLQIFYTAFARLNFGLATAQAWIVGTMLIGFTVYQFRRLSQVEFRTVEKT